MAFPYLTLSAGDTWEIECALENADGSPFDLSDGATIEWVLKDSSGALARSATIGDGIQVIGIGLCMVTLAPIQSMQILPGYYRHSVRAKNPLGIVSTQGEGTIRVKKSLFVPNSASVFTAAHLGDITASGVVTVN